MTKLIGSFGDYANVHKIKDRGYRGLKKIEIVEGNLETWSPSIHTIGETTFVASLKA